MAKEKETLQDALSHRKYKQPNKFVWWVLCKVLVKHFLSKGYNPHIEVIDDINKEEGPCFLIYNHQSRGDYIWLSQATYPRRLNFVTGYNEFFRSKFAFIFKLIGQIPKKNFTSDVASIRGMNQIIKAGGVVCMAPEGMSSITGHNQPVGPGTGKLFKHYGIPVYLCKQKGGFLSNHKVCLDTRTGRVDATLYKLFTPEDLKNLTAEEIETKCDEALWVDEYEWQKEQHIEWKHVDNICSHLHDLCYKCPTCGKEFDMIGEKNYLKCNSCGEGATMDKFYDFHPISKKSILPDSPSKWVDWERGLVAKEIRENPNYEFKVDVDLGMLPPDHTVKNNMTSEVVGKGVVTINHQGMSYKGTRNGEEFEFLLDYNKIHTLVIVTDCTFFSIYNEGIYYDFFPSFPCVGKALLIVEEMHRLHVNTWKQLPWLNDLYVTDDHLLHKPE